MGEKKERNDLNSFDTGDNRPRGKHALRKAVSILEKAYPENKLRVTKRWSDPRIGDYGKTIVIPDVFKFLLVARASPPFRVKGEPHVSIHKEIVDYGEEHDIPIVYCLYIGDKPYFYVMSASEIKFNTVAVNMRFGDLYYNFPSLKLLQRWKLPNE
jgi:hypothetical protein